ncbi:hypothetical protein GCM10009867_16410 [Pedococcus aerophilus]|uniref:Core-binding (CB) domain-containing protein n=1 Tax=Pedococcus aerophilus TaxID=436356 RepID=A0ABP6H313_9MICO
MSVQRYEANGRVRYRARVKSHGREVATRVFDRKQDAVAWEQDQSRQLRSGEWLDPRRGRVTLASLAPEWLESRKRLKRKTREADASAWRHQIEPRFGRLPIASITDAQVAHWVGGLVGSGLSTSTANRYLSTLRSMLAFAVADGRISKKCGGLGPTPHWRAGQAGGSVPDARGPTRLRTSLLGPVCRADPGSGPVRSAVGRARWAPGRRSSGHPRSWAAPSTGGASE